MSVNKKSFICILLASILAAFIVPGCDTTSIFTQSISGVISVPITGEQHYEEDEPESDFGDNFDGAKPIEYEDTAHGTIDLSDVDYFKFSGISGDSIIIDIDAETFGSGLDSYLYLYDGSQTLVASNDDCLPYTLNDPANYIFAYDSHIEKDISSSGDFYIKVEGVGATYGSYQLRLFKYSSEAEPAQPVGLSQEAEFVPDEIIVKYRPGFSTQSVRSIGRDPGYAVLKSSKEDAKGRLELLRLESAKRRLESGGFSVASREDAKKMTLAEVRRLGTLPYVEYAEPNYIMKPTFIPNDTYYDFDYQWNYPLIKLDMVWAEDLVNDVSSIKVAVIDTGIGRRDGTSDGQEHPDLAGIFVDEYDFIRIPIILKTGTG